MTWRRRIGTWLAMALTGGTVFQAVGFTRTGLGTGCNGGIATNNMMLNGLASGVDLCYLFDCTNGFFGGAFLPCDPNNPANDLFIDCSPTTSGTGNNTGTTGTSTTTTTTTGTNTGTQF